VRGVHLIRAAVCRAFLACLLAAAGGVRAAPVVTILEGDAALTRGTSRFVLAEGVKLQQTDIVEVSDKGLLQIEFGDGLIVALGPGARALLTSLGGKAGIEMFVLAGWAKLVTAAPALRLVTPTATLTLNNDVAVLLRDPALLSIFCEQGDIKLAEPPPGKGADRQVGLRNGDFYTRKEFDKGEIASRPAKAFVADLPKAFHDNLPARAARFANRVVEPRKIGEIAYPEAEAWLTSTQPVRRILVPRWHGRAKDTAFRKGLIANLAAHPEWDRILFPEKYLPKQPPPEALQKPRAY